jgi:hypothetical protein
LHVLIFVELHNAATLQPDCHSERSQEFAVVSNRQNADSSGQKAAVGVPMVGN